MPRTKASCIFTNPRDECAVLLRKLVDEAAIDTGIVEGSVLWKKRWWAILRYMTLSVNAAAHGYPIRISSYVHIKPYIILPDAQRIKLRKFFTSRFADVSCAIMLIFSFKHYFVKLTDRWMRLQRDLFNSDAYYELTKGKL